MKKFRIILGRAVTHDILAQSDWYESHAGESLARRWEQSVLTTLERIQRAPRSGPMLGGFEDLLGELRRIPVNRFPSHLIFYQVIEDEVLILRVRHGARDLASLLP
ncbi:plasmid stabilization system [Candidatus Koribacter versatilis Ellin345]|uniref:Plasmid stabilization system n=1 Tax=Koribacter versatilis (strain Ellin345) TaxID=204669 RepID=Q1IML4_KORVE|nr:plasmid stabilization system [Candidatus Koribacter versatilis Ellin345]